MTNDRTEKNMQREKRMFRKLLALVGFSLSLFSSSLLALGMGEISQDSGLNQPLVAEILLLSAGDLAEYEVKASLASNKEFEKVGVERVFFLNKLRFETVQKQNGQIVIKVTTSTPVKEPFLNFVVELNWPNGRILREYTLLLDPPIFEESRTTTINKTQEQSQSTRSAVGRNNRAAAPDIAPSRLETAEQNDTEMGATRGTTYGPVSEADTLWAIALRVRPDRSLSVQQTLVAIYRANPDAFYRGNINNLSKGKVLQIPDAATIRAVPKRAALQDVVVQNRQWREGGARKILDRRGSAHSARTTQAGEARLSLAAANSDGDAQGYGSDANDLAQVQEELRQSQNAKSKLEVENQALKDRLANLGVIEDDSAIQIQDAELAALAREADNAQNSKDQASQNQVLDLDKDEMTEEQPNNALNSSSTTADNGGLINQAEPSNEIAKSQTPPSIVRTVIKKRASLLDEMMDNPLILYGVPGGLLLLILLIIFWRNKKRMEDEEFQFELVNSAGAGSISNTESFDLPDVGDDMLVELDMEDDEDEKAEQPSEDSDPIGEADIYIAYGKHDKAAFLLLEAIEENPIRSDFKVKLMECYAESDEQDKFEALALEVADAVDADEWLNPINDLRADTWGAGDTLALADDSFELPQNDDVFAENEDDLDLDFGDADAYGDGETLALDDQKDNTDELGDLLDSETDTLENFEQDDLIADFELENSDQQDSLQVTEAHDIGALDDAEDDINFDEDDFELDMDDDDMDLDEGMAEDGDEIATKLDLARAYVDMGDSEGAKEILKEVISEGNESQKMEAQALIDKA